MASELDIITIREREVEEELARLRERVAELEAELPELRTAKRVFARLTGAERPPASPATESQSEVTVAGEAPRKWTMPMMIEETLSKAHRRGLRGLEPKDAHAQIVERWRIHGLKGASVSSSMWRMWKRGDLERDGELYRLPQQNEAAGEAPEQDAPTASMFNHVQGREAGPGGGT